MILRDPSALLWLLLALPVIALYLVRPRATPARVGSLLLYRSVERRQVSRAPFARLEKLFSLLLVLLGLASTVVALARPAFGPAKPRRIVAILDASTSMAARFEGSTRFSRATERLRQLEAELRGEDELRLVLAGPSAHVVHGLDDARIEGGHADLAGAFALARAASPTELWLLSDGAGSLDPIAANDPGVPIFYFRVGSPDDPNVGVVALAARALPGSESAVEVQASVLNASAKPATVVPSFTLDGLPLVALEAMEVGPWSVAHLAPRRLDLPAGGVLGLHVTTEGDVLDRDDDATVTVPPQRRARVRSPSDVFLRAALAADDGVELTSVERNPGDGDPDEDSPSSLSLSKGFILGPAEIARVASSLDLRDRGDVTPPRVTKVARSHPVLRHVTLDDAVFARARHVEPSPGWTVLVAAGDVPLLLARERGKERVLVCTFSPTDSDLVLRRAWPLLVSNAVSWLGGEALREAVAHLDPDESRVAARDSLGLGEKRAPEPRPAVQTIDPGLALPLLAFAVLLVETFTHAWTVLRVLTLGLLLLAAARPSLEVPAGAPGTVVALDVSGSTRGIAREQRTSLPVPKGAPSLEFGDESSTEISLGLRLAEARSKGPGRIVLVSDGRETRGSAREEAARLHERGFVVDVFAVPAEAPLDARVVTVDTGGADVREGEGVIVRVEVEATRPCSALVTLARDGVTRPAWTRTVDLRGDLRASLAFPDRAERRGAHRYEARVRVEGDREPANDTSAAVLQVRGGPRALLVELDPSDGEAVARILAAQGFTVKRVSPQGVLPELASADLVVLASGEPSVEAARALDAFVREGGGLLALGGARSYSGWRGTEIEEALPVVAEPTPAGRPEVALVIAIDKSGSMRGPKLELAKLAARNAVWGLGKEDLLGIIAFHYNAFWIVPLGPIRDRAAVQQQIEMQAAGGGTDLLPSLREAKAVLHSSNARVKHFLVLTDGIAGDADAVLAYTAELARAGITTSTVAVGEDAEQGFLERIAMAGEGHHHSAARVSELPRIVLEETLVCARKAMEEEPFKIRTVRPHELLAGIDLATVPALHGLNATKAKPLATVLLEGPRKLPLLATWTRGLGRAAAWTSDATPRWAEALLQHESAPRLFAQLARWLARLEGGEDLEVELRATPSAESVTIRAEARHKDGRFASDVALDARIRSLEAEVARLPLALVAPGRFEGTARVGSGCYFVDARAGQLVLATAGFARSADPERAHVGADRAALEAIARAGGGALDPKTLSTVPAPPPRREPIAWLLLIATALFLPVEIALRRYSIPKR